MEADELEKNFGKQLGEDWFRVVNDMESAALKKISPADFIRYKTVGKPPIPDVFLKAFNEVEE